VNDELLIRLFHRHFADPASALRRLDEHLASVKLPFDLKTQLRELHFPPQRSLPKGLPSFIYYFVPNSRRGTDQPVSDDPLHPSFLNACDGIGLNLGCPVRLLRALDALVQLPLDDQREPRDGLRHAPGHLSAVEELLWLTWWKSPSSLRRGGTFVGLKGDVDWAMNANSFPLLIEAKFRRSDWFRLSDGGIPAGMDLEFLSGATHKFPHPPQGPALHIVGVTTFDNIDNEILHDIGRELEAAPQIHVVVIRTLAGMTHVISLNRKARNRVRKLLIVPAISDYPVNHGVLYNLEQRDKRIVARQPQSTSRKSKAVCWSIQPKGVVPFPMPPAELYRLNIPSRGADGEPHFQIVLKFPI
jgi:hypothetical protein